MRHLYGSGRAIRPALSGLRFTCCYDPVVTVGPPKEDPMTSRRAVIASLVALPAASIFPRSLLAMEPKVFATAGIAMRGIDPVGYFTAGTPVQGVPDHALMWRGATWHFASAASRVRFEMNPTSFAPRYGGYCAYGVAQGRLTPSDPTAWSVHDGALYLKRDQGERDAWRRDILGNVAKADAHWPDVLES
jgi:hypothetical protein